MTHTAKCPKSGGEDVCLILSDALCFFFAFSHDLRHKISHLFGCTFLHLARDMGVGAEREACIEMSEHTRHRFCVYAILKRQGYKCVPLRYNYDKPEKPRISRVFGYLARFFILFQTEKSSREAIISYPGRNRCTACSFLSEQHLVPPARQFPSPCAACPTF